MPRPLKRKKVYVSFDYDKDKYLKDMLVGQSRHPKSPFSIADHSLKEAAPERNWKSKAREKIKNVDAVIVVTGKQTYKAPGVRAEVRMAKKAGIPIIQIRGRKNGETKGVSGAGRVKDWTWKNLNKGIHKKK